MTAHRSIAAALCLQILAVAPAAHAAAIAIEHPWSRPTPPSAPTAVGYLTIINRSGEPDRLVAVSSPAAAQVSVHSMSMTGGVMRMRPVDALPIPPAAPVTLAPDGDHLMFIGLKRPFKAGDHIPVTLTFEHAGQTRTALIVQPPDAGTAMRGMKMSGMDGR
jgi:copper(I)-binding protein